VLVGRGEPDAAIQRIDEWRLDDCEGLFLMPAGPRVPNPGELLTSVKMHRVLRQLDRDYRFILIDSAPVTFSSETVGLATMVDGVVVVAGAMTSKHTIRAVCRRIAGAGAKIFGVVVNGVDVRNSAFHQPGVYYGKYVDTGNSPKAA
jgi:Mrp family chromosome partitioning ATPase